MGISGEIFKDLQSGPPYFLVPKGTLLHVMHNLLLTGRSPR